MPASRRQAPQLKRSRILADAGEKEKMPDVLVSDVGMPEQDGYDLIREVRRRGIMPENSRR